jgi:hypothetical protein
LAAFCWTKSLPCNDPFYQEFNLFQKSSFQSYASRRIYTNSKLKKSDPFHPSVRRDIPSGRSTVQASSIQTTRAFCQDLPVCREASNRSKLHPSGRLSNISGSRSVFDRLWDFFPKHRYGKIATTIRTMCVPFRTLSFIRQAVHSTFNHQDLSLHGRDSQVSFMEITCISLIVQTSAFMV